MTNATTFNYAALSSGVPSYIKENAESVLGLMKMLVSRTVTETFIKPASAEVIAQLVQMQHTLADVTNGAKVVTPKAAPWAIANGRNIETISERLTFIIGAVNDPWIRDTRAEFRDSAQMNFQKARIMAESVLTSLSDGEVTFEA